MKQYLLMKRSEIEKKRGVVVIITFHISARPNRLEQNTSNNVVVVYEEGQNPTSMPY